LSMENVKRTIVLRGTNRRGNVVMKTIYKVDCYGFRMEGSHHDDYLIYVHPDGTLELRRMYGSRLGRSASVLTHCTVLSDTDFEAKWKPCNTY
jgi:hypothetical protein